jgi:hypothetical protein
MARPRNTIPTSRTNLSIPEDLRARLDLALWSPSEQRVPLGAYQEFFVALLREVFDGETIITPFGHVRGSREAIAWVRKEMA